MQRRFTALLAGACMLLLAGCANISAKVTNFNAWPQDAAGAGFSFIIPENKDGDLEQATYQGYVAEQLRARGLVVPPANSAGRFLVDVQASGTTKQKTVLEPVYSNQLLFVQPFRDAVGNVYPGYWAPDQFGSRYIGDREVQRTVNVAKLRVRILDVQQGTKQRPKPVFETQAVYEGDNEDLPDVMPYLVRAMFEGFPGANGRVTQVKFDPRTGEVKR